ncbi:hypothetical protein M2272_004894 [Mycobacterium frederiksbergense]|jgi:hypothetical protein|uniref:Uncharacterized protein n=1 Tax=Mycolicibacterium frederiksbergense TaxID=117567 RepID=A0ABT6L799_9MYCO|nr:hypothetical protein [Mycolicibacterium frederiksbergense]MDH6198235.1 hypothetical protein [Mycolicibacterium frederiksbergense]
MTGIALAGACVIALSPINPGLIRDDLAQHLHWLCLVGRKRRQTGVRMFEHQHPTGDAP